jgi:hypothetical protein
LLRKKHWTDDHQAFHDFYYERLKYDFKGDWEANQERGGDMNITWPERYAAHEQAMLNDPEKRKLWDEYASRPEAVAEMPSGLFGTTSPIPEEKKVGMRRVTLVEKESMDGRSPGIPRLLLREAQVRLQEGVGEGAQPLRVCDCGLSAVVSFI